MKFWVWALYLGKEDLAVTAYALTSVFNSGPSWVRPSHLSSLLLLVKSLVKMNIREIFQLSTCSAGLNQTDSLWREEKLPGQVLVSKPSCVVSLTSQRWGPCAQFCYSSLKPKHNSNTFPQEWLKLKSPQITSVREDPDKYWQSVKWYALLETSMRAE